MQRILRDQGVKFVQSVWEPGAPQPAHQPADEMETEDAAGTDLPRSASAGADRSRGLFGLLPSLLSENEDERPVRPVRPSLLRNRARRSPEPRTPPAAASPSPESMRKLTAALHELTECRKLLAAALAQRISRGARSLVVGASHEEGRPQGPPLRNENRRMRLDA